MREHAIGQSLNSMRPGGGGNASHRVTAGGGAILISACALMASCATVKVQAPDKPIEINLNVKIEQEVRVRLDRDIEDLIASNPDIF